MALVLLAPMLLAASAMPPLRPSVTQIDSRWAEIGRARDGDCELAISGDGKFFLISATGLGAGAPARLVLTNGDMTPIDWRVRASSGGRFARYHLPFRWHRSGGTVSVTLASESCTVTTSFAWRRATAAAY